MPYEMMENINFITCSYLFDGIIQIVFATLITFIEAFTNSFIKTL